MDKRKSKTYRDKLLERREAQRILKTYDFPGNVRELGNIIERAVIVCGASEITETDLAESVRVAARQRERKDHRPTLAKVEWEYIRETLSATKGNKAKAARILGISRKNLYERLARENAEVRSPTSDISSQRSDVSGDDNSDG